MNLYHLPEPPIIRRGQLPDRMFAVVEDPDTGRSVVMCGVDCTEDEIDAKAREVRRVDLYAYLRRRVLVFPLLVQRGGKAAAKRATGTPRALAATATTGTVTVAAAVAATLTFTSGGSAIRHPAAMNREPVAPPSEATPEHRPEPVPPKPAPNLVQPAQPALTNPGAVNARPAAPAVPSQPHGVSPPPSPPLPRDAPPPPGPAPPPVIPPPVGQPPGPAPTPSLRHLPLIRVRVTVPVLPLPAATIQVGGRCTSDSSGTRS